MVNIKQEDIHDICFNISKNIILPKYQNLKEEDIKYKNGSDLVTSADIASEKEFYGKWAGSYRNNINQF